MALIREKELLRPSDLDRTSIGTLARVYNGIGPEAWPERYRKWVSLALARYEPEALVHDWEFVFQPKTYFSFTRANLRFALNSIIKAWHSHHVTGKLFWADAGCGVACALLCQMGGWQAFKTGKIPEEKPQEDV
jgi:hypothetical protein